VTSGEIVRPKRDSIAEYIRKGERKVRGIRADTHFAVNRCVSGNIQFLIRLLGSNADIAADQYIAVWGLYTRHLGRRVKGCAGAAKSRLSFDSLGFD
jgi:hypothetical protein